MANNEIQALIASFTAQLETAAKRAAVEQVIASLGGSESAVKRPGRPMGSKNVATRAPAKDLGPALLSYVRANPGSRADQIAKALGTNPNAMRSSMQALLDSKQVKRSGVRRGTTYNIAGATTTKAAPKAKAPKAAKKRGPRANKKKPTTGQSLRSRLVGLSARGSK